jgi:protein-tyrosine sulfotransferase
MIGNPTPPAVAQSSPRDWPIFVLSSHRSGSTLLRYLLDAHDGLACPPESKFIAGLQQFLDYPQVLSGLRGIGTSSDLLYKELRLFVDRVMRRYTRQVGKRRWVDKTPNYYLHTELIERMFAGEVLYLVLVRHPLDCISSIVRLYPEMRDDPEIARAMVRNGRDRYAWAQYWLDVYTRLDVFMASCQARSMVITYEALIRESDVVLRDIFDFIGETYDAGLVARAFSMSHTPGFGDTKIIRTTRIHDDSIGKWRDWRRQEVEALWRLVGPMAERYGYSIDTPFYPRHAALETREPSLLKGD